MSDVETLQTTRVPRYEVMMPTTWTLFMRQFVPWQLVRFAIINVRMLRITFLSHPHETRERSTGS